MCAHTNKIQEEVQGELIQGADERGEEAVAWACCFPLWAMIDIHGVSLLFYHKKTEEAFTPLRVKALYHPLQGMWWQKWLSGSI